MAEVTSMQHKIDELQSALKGYEDKQVSVLDFENEESMQFFMDQLKQRAVQGSTALKTVATLQAENEKLCEKLKIFEANANGIASDSENVKIENLNLKKDLSSALRINYSIIKGNNHENLHMSHLKSLFERHIPEMDISDMNFDITFTALLETYKKDAETDVLSEDHKPEPSENSHARSKRRSMVSSWFSKDKTGLKEEETLLKPLELELKETRTYLAQVEEELSSTKVKLKQTEAIAERTTEDLAKLERNLFQIQDMQETQGEEILSIKILNETGVQTMPISLDVEEIPISAQITSDGDTELPPIAKKLSQELSLATKAKVDLLRELSKLNKEYLFFT